MDDLLDNLDSTANTMKAIADACEEEGRDAEAQAWRWLAEENAHPNRAEGGGWVWPRWMDVPMIWESQWVEKRFATKREAFEAVARELVIRGRRGKGPLKGMVERVFVEVELPWMEAFVWNYDEVGEAMRAAEGVGEQGAMVTVREDRRVVARYAGGKRL